MRHKWGLYDHLPVAAVNSFPLAMNEFLVLGPFWIYVGDVGGVEVDSRSEGGVFFFACAREALTCYGDSLCGSEKLKGGSLMPTQNGGWNLIM
jgi:hypothetical protein